MSDTEQRDKDIIGATVTSQWPEEKMFDPRAPSTSHRKLLQVFLQVALPSIFTNVLAFTAVMGNTMFASTLSDATSVAVVGLSSTCIGIMV